MNYETFKKLIIKRLDTHLEDPKKITIKKITKNNGQELDGLIIMQNHLNVAPTIYLEHFYKKYLSGYTFSETFQELMMTYEYNRPSVSINASFFTDFENVKDRIVYKIINYELNQMLLKDIPFFRFLDLAIVFYCLIQSDHTGNASILIHNNHLDYWDTAPDDLMALARINTPRLMPHELKNMCSILKEEFSMPITDTYPMFVLTNTCRLNGACCILYQDLIKNIAEQMDTDLYILPSSVHEVILLPAADRDSITALSDMVKDVNATEVAEDEILSDHAYYFSREDNCISV